jgi:uncharacterized protein (TIGR03437 family)
MEKQRDTRSMMAAHRRMPMVLAAVFLNAAAASGAAPRVFFTDLTSGPKSGGQNNAGAFVTIYGRNFGASRGTSSVTIGGGPAGSYPVWTDIKIAIQLGAAAVTGNIVVTTAAGASNAVPFTVRAGNIYFAATSGSDSSSGKYNSPWHTLMHARDTMKSGDITYAMNGVAQTADDGSGWQTSLLLSSGGTAAAPMALVVYPEATATIGSVTGPPTGVRSAPRGGTYPNYWVFAGFTLRGQGAAMALWGSTGWRIVANDFSCPSGNGAGACMDTVESSSLAFYGNNVHDTGIASASALYHGAYFGTDSNHLDIGWNTIANVHGCRGIQIHSTPQSGEPTSGQNQYDIGIHDNTIHDTQCDGIILDTIDPSKGPISVYNNVIYNAGEGPNNPDQSGNWACIYVPGSTENGPPGSGMVDVYNNTLYACGTFASPPYGNANSGIAYGGGNPAIYLRVRNNIVYQTTTSLFPSGVPYVMVFNPSTGAVCADTANCNWIRGSNNLFYGSGPAPKNTNITGSVNADPKFVNLPQWNLHLQSNSPARNNGANTGLQTDEDGVAQGGAEGYDIGAFQFVSGGIAAIGCNPPVALAPGTVSCDVSLTGDAPASGSTISLASDNGSVVVPGTVQFPGGASDASFTAAVAAVDTQETATITASAGDGNETWMLWVLPLGTLAPALFAVVDAASYQSVPLTPGGLVTAFGLNLGPQKLAGMQLSGGQVSTALANTKALFDDTPAPLLYVQANQLSAVVPYEVAGKTSVQVEIEVQGQFSNLLILPVAPAAPGIFTLDSSGQGQGAILNQDYSVNSPANPALRNSIVSVYADGLGQMNPPGIDGAVTGSALSTAAASVSASIDGVDAHVLYAGTAPGIVAGVFQVNVLVPEAAAPGSAVSLVLSAGGASSQAGVTLAIQ